MDPVIVVGAGISGIAAAQTVRASGRAVVVLDRGRRIGGRMGVRTTDGRPVDIGASYFTVSDPSFTSVVQDWQRRGLARPWTDTFHVFDGQRLTLKPGPVRWAAPLGLRSLVEDLAEGLEIEQHEVRQIEPGPMADERRASAVVLAMPDPQAERLLHPSFGAEVAALDDPFDPVLVLTATWERRTWAVDVDGVFVQDDETLSWVADDGSRRGDHAPVLVAHSTPAFAAQHLQEPAEAEAPMLAALCSVLDIPADPTALSVHRWTFAKPAQTRDHPFFLGEAKIGLCGDAWSDKPRVESAFLSGTALGRALVEMLQ